MRCQSRTSISLHDVLFGRTKQATNHPGTVAFRSLVQAFVPKYNRSLPQHAKLSIMTEIMNIVKSRGGRFLRLSQDNVWREITDAVARSTVSQALRDARALSVAVSLQQHDRIAGSKKRSAAQIAESMQSRRNAAPPSSTRSAPGVFVEDPPKEHRAAPESPLENGSNAISSFHSSPYSHEQTAQLDMIGRCPKSPLEKGWKAISSVHTSPYSHEQTAQLDMIGRCPKSPLEKGCKAISSFHTSPYSHEQTAQLDMIGRCPTSDISHLQHRWFFDIKDASPPGQPADVLCEDTKMSKDSREITKKIFLDTSCSSNPVLDSADYQHRDVAMAASVAVQYLKPGGKADGGVASDDEHDFNVMVESLFRDVHDDSRS